MQDSEGAEPYKAGVVFASGIFIAWLVWYKLGQLDKTLGEVAAYVFLREAVQLSTSVMFYWYHETPENCERGYPCLGPTFLANITIASYVFLALGVALYNWYMANWPYRCIFIAGQLLTFAYNLLDLVWVLRLNVQIGISDKLFLFTEELLSPIISKLLSMPMYILVAQIIPKGVEATVFALMMGLS